MAIVQLAQAGGVAVNVYIDSRLNDEFRAAKDEDGFNRFTYKVDDSSGVLEDPARLRRDHEPVEGRRADHGDAPPGHLGLFRGRDPVRPGLRRRRHRQRGEPDRRGGRRLYRHRREHVGPPALCRRLWPGRRLQFAPPDGLLALQFRLGPGRECQAHLCLRHRGRARQPDLRHRDRQLRGCGVAVHLPAASRRSASTSTGSRTTISSAVRRTSSPPASPTGRAPTCSPA